MRRQRQSSVKAAPILYADPCQGIPPVVIEAPRHFFAGQAIALGFGAAILIVLLLVT